MSQPPPPPMKFWEAVSAFREFESALKEVFCGEKWRDTYGDNFSRFEELVRIQDRNTLDTCLPLELTREIASRCAGLRFCLSRDGRLREATPYFAGEFGAITLSALEVHDRFGGSNIEEVLEKGSAKVTNAVV